MADTNEDFEKHEQQKKNDALRRAGQDVYKRQIEAFVFRGAAGSYSPAGVKIGIKIAGLKRRDVYG